MLKQATLILAFAVTGCGGTSGAEDLRSESEASAPPRMTPETGAVADSLVTTPAVSDEDASTVEADTADAGGADAASPSAPDVAPYVPSNPACFKDGIRAPCDDLDGDVLALYSDAAPQTLPGIPIPGAPPAPGALCYSPGPAMCGTGQTPWTCPDGLTYPAGLPNCGIWINPDLAHPPSGGTL